MRLGAALSQHHRTAAAGLRPPPSPGAPARRSPRAGRVTGTAADVFRRGDVLAGGRYRLDAKIADGRFATIWEGTDTAAGGAPVVLKVGGAAGARDCPAAGHGLENCVQDPKAAAGAPPNRISILTRTRSQRRAPTLTGHSKRSAARRAPNPPPPAAGGRRRPDLRRRLPRGRRARARGAAPQHCPPAGPV